MAIDKCHILTRQATHPRLRDLRIVSIGDSLTRYQYLNLVRGLHAASWKTNISPALENEQQWKSWRSYLVGSTFRFGCSEFCDCYREPWKDGFVKENRHYHNFETNVFVDYYSWLSHIPISVNPTFNFDKARGPRNFTREGFAALCSDTDKYIEMLNSFPKASQLVFAQNAIVQFFREIIAPYLPDYLIINQGFWPNPMLRSNDYYLQEFVEAAKNSSKVAIWKTTTAECSRGANATAWDGADFLTKLKNHGMNIFDGFALTKPIAHLRSACWDKVHFNPFVYRELNKQLIALFNDHLKS